MIIILLIDSCSVLFLALLATVTWTRHRDHVLYLEMLLEDARNGQSAPNLWNRRCEHCGRRMHGEAQTVFPSVAAFPGGDRRQITAVFHADRRRCAESAAEWGYQEGKQQ